MPAPIGLGLTDVYFGWHVNDSRRGAVQSAYRIVVSRPILAGTRRGATLPIWDSGKVRSVMQAFVPYGGPDLLPDTTYRWTVQTWDGSGVSGPLAHPGTFDTGLNDSDWDADWIKRPTIEALDTPATINTQEATGIWAHKDEYSYVRKETALGDSPIVRARAYVSADQQYELYVNGTMAAKGEAYSYPDSQYYETTDITHLLKSGKANAFGIIYDWQGPAKGRPEGTPGVIARITVLHADGTIDTITTNGTWEVLPGAWLPGVQRNEEGDPVDYTENINGPAEPIGWDEPGYKGQGWKPATVIGPQNTPPWTRLVSVRTRIVYSPVHAVSVKRLRSGAVVADFGKVYAAIPSVTFSHGVPGRRITMHAGYLLDRSGAVSTTTGTQHTNMAYSYIERGGGRETFRPFDYLGFRYLQIDDPGETLTTKDIVALTRHDAVPNVSAGTFTSSDKTVDAVFALGSRSALYTMQEQFLDTPTREKGPWLGDGMNESETAMDAFGDTNLTRKSLLEFAQSQARYWPNGAINKIYPTALGALEIPQSTADYPEWVWQYWIHTGDRALLTELYSVVVKVSNYFSSYIGPDGLVRGIPGPSDVPQFPTDTQLNLLVDNVFNRVADIAEALDRPATEVAVQRARSHDARSGDQRPSPAADRLLHRRAQCRGHAGPSERRPVHLLRRRFSAGQQRTGRAIRGRSAGRPHDRHQLHPQHAVRSSGGERRRRSQRPADRRSRSADHAHPDRRLGARLGEHPRPRWDFHLGDVESSGQGRPDAAPRLALRQRRQPLTRFRLERDRGDPADDARGHPDRPGIFLVRCHRPAARAELCIGTGADSCWSNQSCLAPTGDRVAASYR